MASKLGSKFMQMRRFASHGHGSDTGGDPIKLWRNLTYFVAFPCIGLGMLNAYIIETHEHHGRPEFVAYEHLRIRNKAFPWGDGNHSLFHNPKLNALPTGYETDE